MAERTQMTGWGLLRMEGLSWLNILISAVILAGALLFELPAWTFWTAVVAAGTIIVLEAFDEWAEQHALAAEVVGPESVILVAALWLVGTVLVVGGPTAFVGIAVVGGLLIVAASAMNLIASFRLDPTTDTDVEEDER